MPSCGIRKYTNYGNKTYKLHGITYHKLPTTCVFKMTTDVNGVLFETDEATSDLGLPFTPRQQAGYHPKKLKYLHTMCILYTHMAGLYGGYLFLFEAKWQTDVFAYMLYVMSILGVTAGVHRLWSHKSYKAKWPLRIILTVFQTLSSQESVIWWAREHRVHHKYTDTDADPHNATRGLFYSHIGYLCCKRHPKCEKRLKEIDMSDLYADPILRFQNKYYKFLAHIVCNLISTVIPVYCWGETWSNAYHVATMFRIVLGLNSTFLINSIAHKFGNKPYDKHIRASENMIVSIFTLGEGFHNYHHAFPWDYKAGELGNNILNVSTIFINFCAKIGWAYDLKTVSDEIIKRRAKRTGDGSLALWGWGDKDQSHEEIAAAVRINPKDD